MGGVLGERTVEEAEEVRVWGEGCEGWGELGCCAEGEGGGGWSAGKEGE